MKNEGFKRFKPPNIWDIHGYTSKNEGNRGNSHGWTITLGWPCLLGAGLSAADAILHALGFEDVRVTHVFLGHFVGKVGIFWKIFQKLLRTSSKEIKVNVILDWNDKKFNIRLVRFDSDIGDVLMYIVVFVIYLLYVR